MDSRTYSLVDVCRLGPDAAARLLGTSRDEFDRVRADPGSVPADRKYPLAVRAGHLAMVVRRARGW